MSLIGIILLAIVQGLTEFLPVSSSGHLVLASAVLGVQEPGIVTEVTLHLGTLVAVLIYFRRDLIDLVRGLIGLTQREGGMGVKEARRLFMAIIVGTIPALLVGLSNGGLIESLFESPGAASIALLFTAAILLTTLVVPKGTKSVGITHGGLIGLFQAFALVPGVSRSGMTIAAGLYLGIERARAARFSFLLAIPAIVGASLFKIPEMTTQATADGGWFLLLGFLVSFAVGYMSIALLLRLVKSGHFGLFGIYCLAVGLVGLIWLS